MDSSDRVGSEEPGRVPVSRWQKFLRSGTKRGDCDESRFRRRIYGLAAFGGALVCGVVYAVPVFFTLVARAYDLDLPNNLVILAFSGTAGVIGALLGIPLGLIFGYFAVRRFRIRLQTLLLGLLVLGTILALNTTFFQLGPVHDRGTSRVYGWPLPGLPVNFYDTVEKEIGGTTSTYKAWDLYWPCLGFNVLLGALLVAVTAWLSERLIRRGETAS